MKILLHTDGGARGNPGPAAIGVVVCDETGRELKMVKETIGSTTNNQAEYQALQKGLLEAIGMGADEVVCYMDSELVVKQLTGQYKIKEPGLQIIAGNVLKLTSKFKKIDFQHVPRAENALADKLVNEALDEEEELNKNKPVL